MLNFKNHIIISGLKNHIIIVLKIQKTQEFQKSKKYKNFNNQKNNNFNNKKTHNNFKNPKITHDKTKEKIRLPRCRWGPTRGWRRWGRASRTGASSPTAGARSSPAATCSRPPTASTTLASTIREFARLGWALEEHLWGSCGFAFYSVFIFFIFF